MKRNLHFKISSISLFSLTLNRWTRRPLIVIFSAERNIKLNKVTNSVYTSYIKVYFPKMHLENHNLIQLNKQKLKIIIIISSEEFAFETVFDYSFYVFVHAWPIRISRCQRFYSILSWMIWVKLFENSSSEKWWDNDSLFKHPTGIINRNGLLVVEWVK